MPPAEPSAVIGFTVIVLTPEPMSMLPAVMTETPATFEEDAVILPVKVSTPPVFVIVGAVPPLLLNVRPVSEFAPAKVSVEPPFMTTDWAAMTPPAVCVRMPPLIVIPVPLAGAGRVPVAPTFKVTPLMTVPPVKVFVPWRAMTSVFPKFQPLATRRTGVVALSSIIELTVRTLAAVALK